MNNHRRRGGADDRSSGMADFGSAPPPPGEASDVHNACTTVAALPDSFLADLRRGKVEEPVTARYKALADTDVADPAISREIAPPPAEPPPASAVTRLAARPAAPALPVRSDRIGELNAAVTAAIAEASAEANREWHEPGAPRTPPPMMPGPVAPPPQYPPPAPPGYGQAYGAQPYGYAHSAQEQWAAQQLENARKAQKLVSLSRWLLLGGLMTMFAGCGGGIALQVGLLGLIGSGLGALVIVAAAVVGQAGRGMQGRVI